MCANTAGKKAVQLSSSLARYYGLGDKTRGNRYRLCVYMCAVRAIISSLYVIMDSTAVCVSASGKGNADTRRIGIRNVMRFAPNRAEN